MINKWRDLHHSQQDQMSSDLHQKKSCEIFRIIGRESSIITDFPGKMKKIYLLLLLIAGNRAYGQRPGSVWTKINLTKNISHKIAIGIDLQHRRQTGFDHKAKSPLAYPLLNSARLWMYYHPAENWKLIVAPIGYFQNTLLVSEEPHTKHSHEIRLSAGVSRDYTYKRWVSTNRLLYEISALQLHGQGNSVRQRYRLQTGLIYLIRKFSTDNSLNYNISNEVMLKTVKGKTGFEQNRLYNGFKWKWKYYDAGLGYQYSFQSGTPEGIYTNQLYINFNWSF
jgi:hypothetical protein